MNPLGLLSQNIYADIQTIGIPRGLLYYRYCVLWETFFTQLGRSVVVSRETDQNIVDVGSALSVDECCLASKIYLGHVASLRKRCDAVFVPSIGNEGLHREFCTKFQGLPDLVENTFYHENLRVVSCFVEQREQHQSMQEAFVNLGSAFGVGARTAKKAWKGALAAQHKANARHAQAQEKALANLAVNKKANTLAILLVAHPYVSHDAYLGKSIIDLLQLRGATVFFADKTDKEHAFKESFSFSSTMPWITNRELIGSLTLLHEKMDGLVLLSAFPCGPDSMTSDAILRCIQGKPILNLTIDGQNASAGLETRIESFVDILRYQKEGGYVHG